MSVAIKTARTKHDLDIWAYTLMPEHVHLLLRPRRESYDISRVLTSLKQSVSKRAIEWAKRHESERPDAMLDRQPNGKTSHRFWQRGGGFDRNIWSPRYIWETIDYIHCNPVRRGLCARDIDWPWSSAGAYAGTGNGPISIDADSLPADPRRINAM